MRNPSSCSRCSSCRSDARTATQSGYKKPAEHSEFALQLHALLSASRAFLSSFACSASMMAWHV
jgi:hypothetical protein